MHDPTAVTASSEDYDRSVAALVAAFICDPFIRWMFPDSRQFSRPRIRQASRCTNASASKSSEKYRLVVSR